MNAVRMTSCSASGGRSAAAGDGAKAHRVVPGGGVQRVDEGAERVVAVGLAERDRVLDLLEADDVGVEGVDRA